jgi:hypothetical protein
VLEESGLAACTSGNDAWKNGVWRPLVCRREGHGEFQGRTGAVGNDNGKCEDDKNHLSS